MVCKAKMVKTSLSQSLEEQNLTKTRQDIVGIDVKVPLLNGQVKQYIYLDNAASTPMLKSVLETVNEFMQWYSSVHRGSGFKSKVATQAYDEAREIVADFFGANHNDHVVIFGKNTTEAINKLARRLDLTKKDVVLVGLTEHHSNDLPWRQTAEVHRIDVDKQGSLVESHLDELLAKHKGRVKLVAITGASNVTGYMPDIYSFAKKSHAVGAQILVDCAQLAPHREVKLKPLSDEEHLDYIAVSAHKMYAPLGVGALIGRKDTFKHGAPDVCGGGTIKVVTKGRVEWADPPDREEAGSPNVVGAVAFAKALKELSAIGMDVIAAHEAELTGYALQKLNAITGLKIYGDTDHANSYKRLGVISLNVKSLPHALVAAILSAEWGIGVRDGCFCAHPYVTELLGIPKSEIAEFRDSLMNDQHDDIPGMVRVSFGMYNTKEEIDTLADGLDQISNGAYEGRYEQDIKTGEYNAAGWRPEQSETVSFF
jgi:cysteine desulfurase/selenocysteine lyase